MKLSEIARQAPKTLRRMEGCIAWISGHGLAEALAEDIDQMIYTMLFARLTAAWHNRYVVERDFSDE